MTQQLENKFKSAKYGFADNGVGWMKVGEKANGALVQLIAFTDTNGDPLPALDNGLSGTVVDTQIAGAEYYPINGTLCRQLISNSIEPFASMQFMFSSASQSAGLPATVGAFDAPINVSAATTEDQNNYNAWRDLIVAAFGG